MEEYIDYLFKNGVEMNKIDIGNTPSTKRNI